MEEGQQRQRQQQQQQQPPPPPPSPDCSRCASFLTGALLGLGGEGGGASSSSSDGAGRVRSLLRAMGASASLASPEEARADGGAAGATVRVSIPSGGGGTGTGSRNGGRRSSSAVAAAAADAGSPPETLEVDPPRTEASAGGGGAGGRVAGPRSRLTERLTGVSGSALATSAAVPRAGSGRGSGPRGDGGDGFSVAISCRPCLSSGPEGNARAYVRGPDPLSVVLCSNQLRSPSEVSEVLVHELIHVYDVRVRGLDLRDCRQLAYSEVRAAREAECGHLGGSSLPASGCASGDSAGAGGGGGGGGGGWMSDFARDMCVRSRAGVATCNMFPDSGRGCVSEVFERAVRDRAPFVGGGAGGGGAGAGTGADGAGGGNIFGAANEPPYSSAR